MIDLSLGTLQWMGCATGVTGSLLLALNQSRISGFGFIAYLLSNACWVGYALSTSATGLAVQQAVFTLTSLIGVWRWLIVPARLEKKPNGVSNSTNSGKFLGIENICLKK